MPETTKTRAHTRRAKSANTQRLTKESLDRLADKDRPALVAVAAEYGIYPGRGITMPVMVKRILEADNGAPTRRDGSSTKATAPTKRSVSKATAAAENRAATPRRLTVVSAKNADGAATASTSQVPKEAIRQFIDAAVAALEVAKALL